MARDEVDPAFIINDHRKRKLGSYATNEDNISADKHGVVKRMKLTLNASNSCEQKKYQKNIDNFLNFITKCPLENRKKQILRLI